MRLKANTLSNLVGDFEEVGTRDITDPPFSFLSSKTSAIGSSSYTPIVPLPICLILLSFFGFYTVLGRAGD